MVYGLSFRSIAIFVGVVLAVYIGKRENNMSFLPKPTGPYAVAATDIVTAKGKDGTMFRLFYPTKPYTPNSTNTFSWITEPQYSHGMANFMRLSWLGGLVNSLIKNYQLPVHKDGPLDLPNNANTLPIFVFSHGLGGSRHTQSFTCYDLASHGAFVAAIEHKDQSGCATYYLHDEKDEAKAATPNLKWLHNIRAPSDKEQEFQLRNKQINQRAQECSKLMNDLIALNEGKLSNELQGIPLSTFKGRMNFHKCGIYGHSFGGGTVVKTLAQDKRFKVGVMLDVWLYPVEKEFYHKPIDQPMLFINNEAFMWPENVNAIRKLDADVHENDAVREMFTIKGAVHWSQTDLTHIIPQYRFANRIFKAAGTTDANIVDEITGAATRHFFHTHLDGDVFAEAPPKVDEHEKYSPFVLPGSNIKLDEETVKKSKEKIRSNI